MEINSNFKVVNDFEWDEELREWLENYIDEHPHHNTNVLSRSQYIGLPCGVLDSYLAKTYFKPKALGGEGNKTKTSKVEPIIRAYRNRVGGTVRHGYGKPFFETNTWKQMRNALRIALKENAIVVVYGKPGVGKSKALSEFALREMSTAPLIYLCSRNVTAHYFVKALAQELNVKSYGQIAEIEDAIIQKLEKYPRALFADQANFLNERSLGSICQIWEKTRIPIALVGTKTLFDTFMRSTLTEDVRAQLTSRIAIHYLLPELKIEEVMAIVQHSFGVEATDEMVTQIYNITGGIHRNVEMLIARISDLKEKNLDLLDSGEVKMNEIIDIAGSRLMIA
ncbi:MAG: AAA family ATPase [Blastocatellia bacterium]|nr:AAA family ATPase [Blastocatellia bacterium]